MPLFSHQWLKENKVFWLDTVDIRMGMDSATHQVCRKPYRGLSGWSVDRIDELEVEILPFIDFFYADKGSAATTANQWHTIATASTIYTTCKMPSRQKSHCVCRRGLLVLTNIPFS